MIIYYHKWAVTYKVANDYLALSMAGDCLSRGLLGSCGAGLSRVLLDTTDRRSGSGTSGRTTLASTAIANGTSLSREDLVKRLVELARHVDLGCCFSVGSGLYDGEPKNRDVASLIIRSRPVDAVFPC